MTTLLLEKIGVKVVSERNPRILNVPGVGEIQVGIGETYADIFESVFDKGFKDGVLVGKIEKINELKSCLNIEK